MVFGWAWMELLKWMEMATESPLRLNLGGGDVEIEGFTNVDRKHGQEAYPLNYGEETVVEI